ncbi:hypothetical protein KI387_038222, partial [Taxus chinensis]
ETRATQNPEASFSSNRSRWEPECCQSFGCEFSYINENLVDFTDVKTEEEAREREARADEEIRAQLEEIERLQAEADERAATEAIALARLEDRNIHRMGDQDHEREWDREA